MKKVLLSNIRDPRIKEIATSIGAIALYVAPQHYFTPLNNLMICKYTTPMFPIGIPESILVLCNIEDEQIDQVLALIKQKKLNIDYKAILTPYNQQWSLLRLYNELKKEKEGMK